MVHTGVFHARKGALTFLAAVAFTAGWVRAEVSDPNGAAGAAQVAGTTLSLRFDQPTQQPTQAGAPEKAADKTDKGDAYNILTTKRLTGDWGGVRKQLEEKGIDLSFVLTTSYVQNFRGGLNTHNADAFSGDWRMNLQLDFEKMGLYPGGFFFIRGKSSWNNGVDAEVGSLGPIHWVFGSGGDEEFYVDKWWYGQRLWDRRLEFRVGKLLTSVDLFDNAVYANLPWDQFMNAHLNYSPNVPHRKALGVYGKIKLCDWMHFHTAAADADQTDATLPADVERGLHGPANYIGLWEVVLTPSFPSDKGKLSGNYRFGWWYDGRSKRIIRNELDGLLAPRWRNDDVGGYITFDQLAWKENDDPKDKQGLGVFMRYAFAHPETNRINHFWSLGAQYEGLLPERNKDVLAFGVAQSIMSKTLRHEINPLADRETIYELYYALWATPWCVITPDLQFITNPGAGENARDAIVGGVRVKIAF